MRHDLGASASPSGSRPSDQAPAGLDAVRFDPSREKSAFMAGWLTRHHRSDVAPEDAWLTYLDSLEGMGG